ncbi:CD99 molecule isoform X1 [Periophthalmus magnuspinnatus]|uniref:CD99 molecule isoform X1 n=1 Tax=Periophthalmus magnuspinnatus TaxID=409849 RepID=UPI00145BE91C|nr:CD99 molecule isoform X1 [Periophthalmus magnuspinnatus]
MKLFFRIAGLFLLLSGTLAQDMNFDLADALDDGPKVTAAPPKKDKDMTFDLSDAFGDDDPVPTKPPVVAPPSGGGGGGGTLKDTDLFDVGGGGGGYEPDGGRSGGRGMDPEYNPNSGGGDQAQEAGSGPIAGIVSAIGVALVGAASSYFAYQKKKLCFKVQGGQDPESGNRHMTQSEPQVMSTLLQSS